MSQHRGPLLHDRGDQGRRWYFDLPLGIDPAYALVEYDDFVQSAFDTTNHPLGTVVKDTGASVAIAADTAYGRLLLTSTATTDNDGASIQGNEVYAIESGRDIWFETTLQISDADQMDVFVGMLTNFTTNPENALTTADRVGFQIDDGGASILCKTEKNGTETSTDSGVDAADATDVKLGFHVYDDDKVEFFVNGNLVATHTANLPDDENLAICFMELSGDANGTKSMSIDYYYAAMTR